MATRTTTTGAGASRATGTKKTVSRAAPKRAASGAAKTAVKAPRKTARTAAASAPEAVSAPRAEPVIAAVSAPAPAPVESAPAAEMRTLRKKELVERIVDATDVKKRDVKPVVEAMLRILGDALAAGEELALPPFGKAKVNRQKDLPSGEMLVIRLRRQGQSEGEDSKAADDTDS